MARVPRTPSIINCDPSRVIPDDLLPPYDEERNITFDLSNIQGDVLAAFNKPYPLPLVCVLHINVVISRFTFDYPRCLLLLGLKITNEEPQGIANVKNWLSTHIRGKLTSTIDVMSFRDKFRSIRNQIKGGTKLEALRELAEKECLPNWLNIAFSHKSLVMLLAEDPGFTDKYFKTDLAASRAAFNDPDPKHWIVGGNSDNTIDILLQVGVDVIEPKALGESKRNAIESFMLGNLGNGALKVIYRESGFRNPEEDGHEQFGFHDGLNQPAVRGTYVDGNGTQCYYSPRTISKSEPTDPPTNWNQFSLPGNNLVWPGELVFGYPPPSMQQAENPERTPYSAFFGKYPSWAKDGSLLVFRRLHQDVPMFWNFIHDAVNNKEYFPNGGITEDELGALLMGRWLSGAPLMRTIPEDPTQPHVDIPALGKEPLSQSNFGFHTPKKSTPLLSLEGEADEWRVAPADHRGLICPFMSHIRKMNPRILAEVDFKLHLILRRGSPYGPFKKKEERRKPDEESRGLLFIAYQASIEQGTHFLQSFWANLPFRPLHDAGHDPIIGQPSMDETEERLFVLKRNHSPKEEVVLKTNKRWVTPTGGGFFFVPPINFLNEDSILFRK